MLYTPETLNPMQTLPMVQNILHNCNLRIHTIFARVETITKIFVRRTSQNSLVITFMPQSNLAFPPTDSCHLHLISPDDTPITYSCSGKQGALLYLPFLAALEETIAHGDFGKWIIKNIDDCLKVAEDLGCGVNRAEDIILVTGRHLARSWISVAFSESRGGAGSEVSFAVRMSGDSSIRLDERNVNGGELKLGPSGRVRFCTIFSPESMLRNIGPDTSCQNLPENQCIFIQGYRVVRILNIWPRIRAAGYAPDMHEPEPESDLHLGLIGIPSEVDVGNSSHHCLPFLMFRSIRTLFTSCRSILLK